MEFQKKGRATGPVKRVPGVGPKVLQLWGNHAPLAAFSWGEVDTAVLLAALTAVGSANAAIMFGVAQGGRGLVISVFLDGERAKTYAGSAEELESILLECVDSLSSSAEDLRAEFGVSAK